MRVQKGILRFKFSTTQKPWGAPAVPTFNKPSPCYSAPPPFFTSSSLRRVEPAAGANQQLPTGQQCRKRRKASPPTPSPKTSSNKVNNETTPVPAPIPSPINNGPPEVLRDHKAVEFDLEVSDLSLDDDCDDSAADLTYTSKFETSNPFSVLSCDNSDNIDKTVSDFPLKSITTNKLQQKKDPANDTVYCRKIHICKECYPQVFSECICFENSEIIEIPEKCIHCHLVSCTLK